MKRSVVTSSPTSEPLTLAEVKTNLKLGSSTSEDARITGLIESARRWCENYTNRSFIKQTRTQYMDSFYPCDSYNGRYSASIELLNGPLLSVGGTTVISVKYYDTSDVQQTVSSSDYWIDANSSIPRIVTKTSWPTSGNRPNAIEIAYYAGYGTDSTSVPGTVKDAMHMYIAHCYENRVPEIVGAQIYQFELGIKRLLDFETVYQNAF